MKTTTLVLALFSCFSVAAVSQAIHLSTGDTLSFGFDSMRSIVNRFFLLSGVLLLLPFAQRLVAGGVVHSCTQSNLESALSGGGTVAFACDGTITFSNTLTISCDTVLDGSGHAVILSGNNAVRLFIVEPGVQLGLINLTIANGFQASANSPCGGGIFNNGGILTATNCAFVSNQVGHAGFNVSSFGGALCNSNGATALVHCSFLHNQALGGYGGGGAYDFGKDGNGGAVHNGGGNLVVLGSFFLGNNARGGVGLVRRGPNWITAGVGGSSSGGAILNAGTLLLTNSTFVTNTVIGGYGQDYLDAFGQNGSGMGGAICNNGGTATLVHATIAGNTAASTCYGCGGRLSASDGGGIFGTTAGLFVIINSIVANSLLGGNCYGAINDGGHNVSSDGSCPFSSPGSMANMDPMLGPMGDYGGMTPVLPLLEGSPAKDAADPTSCPAVDQRGFLRPVGPGCDIGAFEGDFLSFPLLTSAFSSPVIMTGSVAVLTFSLRNPSSQELSNVSFNAVLPVPVRIADPTGIENRCGSGNVVAVAGARSISVAGVNLGPGTDCSINVSVTADSWAVVTNVTGPVFANEMKAVAPSASAALSIITPCDSAYPGTNYAVDPSQCGHLLQDVSGGGMDNLADITIETWARWRGFQPAPDYPYGAKFGAIFSRNGYYTFLTTIALDGPDPQAAKITWSPYHHGNPAIVATKSVGDATWHHIAITFRSGDHRLYVDGVLEGSSTETGTIYSVDNYKELNLDYLANATTSCTLDEIRIWKVIRNEQEIRQNMNRVVDASDPRLTAYWRMDSFPAGGVEPDLTGNGHDLRFDLGSACFSWWAVSTAPLGRGMLLTSQYSGGKLRLILTGAAAQTYVLQSSPDLLHWSDVATNSPATDCVLIYDDMNSLGLAQRFYRGVSP